MASRAPIKVVLTEEEKSFSIEVGDEVPGPGGEPGPQRRPGHAAPAGGLDEPESEADADGEDEMGLAVISGLVDDVEVRSASRRRSDPDELAEDARTAGSLRRRRRDGRSARPGAQRLIRSSRPC